MFEKRFRRSLLDEIKTECFYVELGITLGVASDSKHVMKPWCGQDIVFTVERLLFVHRAGFHLATNNLLRKSVHR